MMKLKAGLCGAALLAMNAAAMTSDKAAQAQPPRLRDLAAWPETMTEARKVTPLGQFGMSRVMQLQLKAGSELSAHAAPERVLVVVLSGRGSFDFNGEVVTLHERQMLHMHPDEMHAVKADTDMDLLLVRINEPRAAAANKTP